MSEARTLRGDRVRRARVCLLNLLFFAISCLAVESTAFGATVRDEFDAISYSGNNGSSNWTNSWQESGESDGVSSGFLRVTSSGSCTAGNCIRIGYSDGENRSKWLWREADTSGATTAILSYDLDTSGDDEGWVDVEVRVGGGSWNRLDSYKLDSNVDACGAFDISSYIGTDTQIRFWGTNDDHDPGDSENFAGFFHFDNIEILTDSSNGNCTDVGVTKSDSADPVRDGTQFTYNLTATIHGAFSGTNVTVVDTLPAGVTYQSATPSQGSCSESGGVVTCPLGTIAASGNATIAIVVTAPSTTGVINNSATVSMDQTDTNSGNDTDNEATTIVTPCPSGGTVNTTTDLWYNDTLRACIIWANENAGTDTITVPAGTYTLTASGTGEDAGYTGDLDITDDIIINGNAAAATIIDGNSLDRVFDVLGASMTASNLTIRDGDAGGGTDDGGGIAIDATSSLTLSTSTVSGNNGDDGGGIFNNGGTVTLTNVTVSGNTTSDTGAGVHCQQGGPCTLTNVTVTGNNAANTGDGVMSEDGSDVTFLNTIVANNDATDCVGPAIDFVSSGYNLSSDATCDFTNTGDQENTDPLLGVLQNNGGPTDTHALDDASPAIDNGTNTGCPATDQRGTARPYGGACDVGAYEATPCPSEGTVTSTGDAATGNTLRACIIWANDNPGADTISFNIPGGGPHTIMPASAYPNITDTITIDGTTDPSFVSDPIIELDGTFVGGTGRGLWITGTASGSTIRGLVINSYNHRGIQVNETNVTIVGNWIGLDVDGVTAAGNASQGLYLTGSADNNTIGGTLAADRNVISANTQGIHVRSDNNVISGNYVGTDATGAVTTVGNSSQGIRLNTGANNNMIGGTTAAHSNIIAGNNNDGIDHRSTGTANSFLRNSIYANSNIGIDLAHDGASNNGAGGVTENDAGDPDPGANNLLNFPEISSAFATGGTVDVDFDLDVAAGNYRIEFFANPSGADGSGNGEGEVYQDSVSIAHGGTGVERFSHSFAGATGDILTATATIELGGSTYDATSEFGDAFTAVVHPCPGGIVGTTTDSATGDSLRGCINWANINFGADTLTVPAGTHTLTIAGTGENAAATGDLDITDDIIINGNAAAATIVDGNSLDRVFDIRGASATFTNVTVSGGSITTDGGGITVDATGSLTMSLSTVSSNTTTTDGGGIATAGGTVDLTNVTLSGNTAASGGGLDCIGDCTLTNVTVTANTAPTAGDGVRQTGAGTITFLNTVVGNNLSGGVNECDGSASNLVSSGYNLSSDTSCDFTSPGDQDNTDPLLGPLQDNGGPTFTHELLAGSAAIDGGTDTGCPANDQRSFNRLQGTSCDVGAYELDQTPAAVTAAVAEISPNDVTTNAGAYAFSYDINATITGTDTGVNQVVITVPGTFTVAASPVTNVLVDGASVAFTDNTVGNAITVDLTSRVTESSRITILFTANAPTTEDLTGVDFVSTVDDAATIGELPQDTTEGNADGDTTDLDSWTVTSTDLATPPPGACTIEIDGTVSTGTTTGSSITISHTTSGTNRLMLVGVSILNGANEEVVNPGGITYNGDNLTRVGVIWNTQSVDPANDGRVEIWRLVAPDTGTHDVVITFDADLLQAAVAGVMTFNGVDQTTPLGSFASNEADGSTSSVSVPSAVDDLVYAVMAGERTGTVSAISPATERWSLENGDATGAGATRAGAAGNVTVSFSHGSDHWAVGGVSIKPAINCNTFDHFSIADNGNSDCFAESVTIAAHSSGHSVVTAYEGLVRLTTSTGNGDWSIITGSGTLNTSGNGNATYFYDASDNGSVNLSLLNTTAETVNVDATDGSATEDAGEDPDFVFTTGGGGGSDVTILDSWVVDGSYATQDATFNVSAGTDRLVLVGLSAEKNASGPMSVTSVSLGDQVLTEVFDLTAGSSTAYHNLNWLGYLPESQIASRSGSALTIAYANAPGNPFDEPKIHYASYENVDQTTPIADSSSNSSSSAASLQLGSSITAGEGDKIVAFNVLGQHYSPAVSTGGYTELTESIGAENGHASAIYHRTATTATTENPTFTSSAATRMAVSAVVLNAAAGGGCGGASINHFSISHDGTGINCQAEPVTIEAHDSGHSIVTGYTGAISLSTSTTHGDWSVITGAGAPATTGRGKASYAFDATDNGSVVLGLKDTFVETVNINVTDGIGSEDSGEDPNLVFARAGFNFLAGGVMNTIGTQISGKASNVAPGAQTLELQAVKTSDDTGACEAALTGSTTIDIGFECEDPIACTANQLAFSGANLPNNANSAVLSYTGISMDFGDDTDNTATFTVSYPDVGKVKLHARTRIMPSGEAMLGGSNSFVVRPFAFRVTATDNPGATGPGGAIFTSAGTNFSAKVRALLWEAADDLDNDGIADNHDDSDPSNNADLLDNTYALNFGNETVGEDITLTAALDQPSGGVDPGLSGGTTVGTFTDGRGGTDSIRFNEVGIIELSAALADSNYLGIGALETGKIRGKSGYVGRFNPAQYAVTATSIVPACGATFTYARQTFTGSMTVEAQSGSDGGNTRTANYRGGFVTLDPDAELTILNDQTAAAYDAKTVTFNEDFSSVTAGEAKLDLQFRWDMAEQAPTTSTVQNTAVTDEVTTLASAPVDIGTSPTRYGRVSLGSAVGSELVNLGMPMRTEYYLDSSTGYVINTADSCSTGVSLSFSNFADNLDSGETCVEDTGSPGDSGAGCVAAGPMAQRYDGPPITGLFNLFLDAPGAGNDGSVSVDAVVPDWLQFDWDTVAPGLENPSGRATFGIYGGHVNEIYRRELY